MEKLEYILNIFSTSFYLFFSRPFVTCFPSKSCEESFSQEPSRKWIKQSCSSLLIEAGEGGEGREGRAKESYAIILVGGQRRATALGNTHFSTWAWFKKKTRANLIRPLFLTNRMKRELCRFFTLTTYILHTTYNIRFLMMIWFSSLTLTGKSSSEKFILYS